ncbi:MAG: hypothetical protein HXN12_00055 [Porphyromonadaceae bacterium]|nr:hypothetical protein [Porphyromonadaceae bacterium]
MKIIEVNHKTVASLLKKHVAEHWFEDKDTWLKFTDGSVVCIHVLNPKWETYVSLGERKEKESTTNGVSFNDSQDIHLWYFNTDEKRLFTSRTVSINFYSVHYYVSDRLNYPTRQHVPIIEFYYYEEGEPLGDYDS